VRPKSNLRRLGCREIVRTVLFLSAAVTPPLAVVAAGDDASHRQKVQAATRLGEELFHREWVAGDSRSPGGDGLGPVYNETSCVACHNLGGVGGAGASTKNVLILSAISQLGGQSVALHDRPRVKAGAEKSPVLASMFAFVRAENERLAEQSGQRPAAAPPRNDPVTAGEPQPADSPDDATVKGHPGFNSSTSVTLHRFGTNPAYEGWRFELLGLGKLPRPLRISDEKTGNQRFGPDPGDVSAALNKEMMARGQSLRGVIRLGTVAALSSERNTTSLFGAGLIDAIPDAVIEAAAAAQSGSKTFPEIHGRVSRLADGRIGRFGWKGQMASLQDFVLTACAVELGLEVPGHHQSSDPLAYEMKAHGLDLSAHECAALTSFVAILPAPVERASTAKGEKERIAAGRSLFTSIGCASCHRPEMGIVAGLYSDLLLHDMGPSLGDVGSYGSSGIRSIGASSLASRRNQPDARSQTGEPNRQEWRTPPLWGIRDSGPYLHDGRATTLEQAIAIHGGEGHESAQAFASLDPQEKSMLITFLKSLVAPTISMARRDLP
jgi:CxxC motif-containing protein (DUF1111 family)